MSERARVLEFISFCIEMCANRDSVSGRNVMSRFQRFGVLEYLERNYEALHTQGFGYILPLIDDYTRRCGVCVSPEARRLMFKSDFFASEKAFRSLLPGKIALTCERIAEQDGMTPIEALVKFYESPAYRELETESSKRWWESPAELARDWKAGV